MNKFDFGIPVGGGYEFKNNVGVGIRLIKGLGNVNNGEGPKDHNLVIALRGTYSL